MKARSLLAPALVGLEYAGDLAVGVGPVHKDIEEGFGDGVDLGGVEFHRMRWSAAAG